MRKLTTFTALALLMAGSAAAIADGLPSLKDAPVAPPASPWDVAFGGGIASDYVFRGISQSARQASPFAYTELRYNVTPTFQVYGAVAGEGLDYPNRAAAEIDLYGGIRPTFDKLALDIGYWYYAYPGGRLYNGLGATAADGSNASCTNGFVTPGGCNVSKASDDYWEVFGKGTYTFNDTWSLTGDVFYSPSWINTGAYGTYASGILKANLPANWFASKDFGGFISGEFGHYWFGTTDAFYANTPLPEYNTWNVGLGLTWKVITLDLRYYDTDLSEANCNVLTADHTASYSPGNVTALNPSGLGSNWCGSAFVAKLSFDLTASTNLK